MVTTTHGQSLVYAVEFNQPTNRFGTLNLLNGSFTQIAALGNTLINDVAYRTQNGKLYGVRNNGANLVTINTTNGAITAVANLSVSGIQSIAFRPVDGVLFGATQSKLYKINITNGTATLVGNYGSAPKLGTSGQNIRFAQDGNLYVSNTSTNTSIYRINTTNGSALLVGEATGFANLVLENGGQYMYGVSIAIGTGATTPELLGFDLASFVNGGTNADGSTHQITVNLVGASTNFPVNFNFSGDVPQPVVEPTVPVSAVGPGNLTNWVSTTAVFSTVASGTPPYGYVWSKSGTNISGQTNSSLTLSNVSVADAATYRVVVTGAMGSVTNSATLTVISPLSAPVAIAASAISTNTFTANWRASTNATTYYLDVSTNSSFDSFVSGYNNLNVGNVTNSLVAGLVGNTMCYYRVRASNSGGTTTNSTTISVTTLAATLAAISSSANPSATGSSVTFTASVTVVGNGTPTGSVLFLADGASMGSPAALTNGLATLTTAALAHGTHIITVQYAGNGNFLGSTNSLSPNQVINARPTIANDSLPYYQNCGAKVRIAALLANDTDPENDVLTFSSVSSTSAAGGAVTATNNWIFYIPLSGFTNSDAFDYVVTDSFGLQATGSVSVTMVVDSSLPQNVSAIEYPGNNASHIRFQGIAGRTYTIQYAESLLTPVWQSLGTSTADAAGRFEFTDTPDSGSPARFYRSTYP